MHSIKVEVQDSVFDKVIYFLNNSPKHKVVIVEDKQVQDDWSYLESEIDLADSISYIAKTSNMKIK